MSRLNEAQILQIVDLLEAADDRQVDLKKVLNALFDKYSTGLALAEEKDFADICALISSYPSVALRASISGEAVREGA